MGIARGPRMHKTAAIMAVITICFTLIFIFTFSLFITGTPPFAKLHKSYHIWSFFSNVPVSILSRQLAGEVGTRKVENRSVVKIDEKWSENFV